MEGGGEGGQGRAESDGEDSHDSQSRVISYLKECLLSRRAIPQVCVLPPLDPSASWPCLLHTRSLPDLPSSLTLSITCTCPATPFSFVPAHPASSPRPCLPPHPGLLPHIDSSSFSPCPTLPRRPSRPQFFLGSKLNVVLLVIPFAIISKVVGWGDGPTCALSMVALIPLAEVRQAQSQRVDVIGWEVWIKETLPDRGEIKVKGTGDLP